jgi:hypothetical protein
MTAMESLQDERNLGFLPDGGDRTGVQPLSESLGLSPKRESLAWNVLNGPAMDNSGDAGSATSQSWSVDPSASPFPASPAASPGGGTQVADVCVNYFPEDAVGLGHLGIGVNSCNTCWMTYDGDDFVQKAKVYTGFSVPGTVKEDDLSKKHKSTNITTTSEQDNAIREFIERAKSDPGYYNANSRNCSVFVGYGLKAGDVSCAPSAIPDMPDILFNDLKRRCPK